MDAVDTGVKSRWSILDASALTGCLAHELNNIAAALQGFIELADEASAANGPAKSLLEEMRIGTTRIGAIAADLQLLADSAGQRARVALIECLKAAAPGHEDLGIVFTWNCEPSLLVDADPLYVRLSVEALGRISAPAAPGSAHMECTVESCVRAQAQCSDCGAGIELNDVCVRMRVRSAPASLAQARGESKRLTPQRLTLAAVAHGAHRAGGHVLIDPETGGVAIVLKTAK